MKEDMQIHSSFEHLSTHMQYVENSEDLSSLPAAFDAIRPLGLEDFGAILWAMPDQKFPKLSEALPKMATEDVQNLWTGASGFRLLEQSLSFVRACAASYASAQNRGLAGQKILDFGCGYGRFLRLFSYFSDEVYGVDPWDKSIEQCQAAGFGDRVKLSEAVPEDLPFDGPFEFIFAFSVFTHLSESSTHACLNALRAVAADDALFMLTLRPIEFWDVAMAGHTHLTSDPKKMKQCIKDHRENGFAYYCTDQVASPNYGDTSISMEWLANNVSGWEVVSVDRSLKDPYQRYVMLRAI
ncbi:class I SAM-dependent methyltransferase [Ruegeria arenilitoris]|uniref:class I SAM-dependent methyltransferase n=1 Tax=Ruegeria arenilitoris TaxID=1173585 RepID=UPI00147D16C2|nr:class I SAM-dependent methyltransferase [Ruegeria arenilitoris]